MGSVKARHWREIPERGSAWGIAILRVILRIGGLRVMRVVLAPVAFYYLLTHGVARTASRDYISRLNLYCSKRGLPCPLPDDWRGVYQHIYSFALGMAEKYAAWSGGAVLGTSIQKDGLEVARRLTQRREGVVLLASHLGNFDISIAFGAFDTGRRFRILIDHAGMRRFNDLRFSTMRHDRIVFHDADNVGPETAVELRRAVDDGDIVVLAADRLGAPGDDSVRVRLLDGQAVLPVGPWVIAHLLGCPVYAVFACREGTGYRLIPFVIGERVELGSRAGRRENIRQHAQHFADCMERVMLRYPEQWYNFFQFWHEDK